MYSKVKNMADKIPQTLKNQDDPTDTLFDFINKDLDFLFLLVFLEAFREGGDLLKLTDLFKGNYWNINDIADEVADTNDYYSISDMVFQQSTFIFQELQLGKIVGVLPKTNMTRSCKRSKINNTDSTLNLKSTPRPTTSIISTFRQS